MKKKILVPVDFSICSHNAYLYARELAQIYDAELEVIHVYFGNFNTVENPALEFGKSSLEVLENNLQEFTKLHPTEGEVKVVTDVKVTTNLIHGFTVQTIKRRSSEEDVFLIVMGSTGQSDVVDQLMGRISSAVAQQAYCPVFLVPKGIRYFGYSNILFASNYESASNRTLQKVIDFNQKFNAALHFIHVEDQNEGEEYKELEDLIFKQLFKDGEPEFAFNLANIQSKSVMKGLFQYAEENSIDLVVMVNRQRSFFASLFGHSMTKKMALKSRFPMLIYHLDDEELI